MLFPKIFVIVVVMFLTTKKFKIYLKIILIYLRYFINLNKTMKDSFLVMPV